MTCQKCAALQERIYDLEDEVRHLRRELGHQDDAGAAHALRLAFRRLGVRHPKGAARLIGALKAANGRVVSVDTLLGALPPVDGRDPLDRSPHLVRVWVNSARNALGFGSIESVHGEGYRLSPLGVAKVAEILSPEIKAPPTGQGGGLTSASHLMLRPGE